MCKVDVKLSLRLTKYYAINLHLIKGHAMKVYGGVEVYIHAFLIPALDGNVWSASRTGRFTTVPRIKESLVDIV
jgi:hypothetical protein